jgi:osmotically inducible protein OsmC
MSVRKAQATWRGKLKEGEGFMRTGSGVCKGGFSYGSRFKEEEETNPEELIGAALAGCYSMALSYALEKEGHVPQSVATTADVHLEKADGGFEITVAELKTVAHVSDLSEEKFQALAREVKENCPVSRALEGGPEIRLSVSILK